MKNYNTLAWTVTILGVRSQDSTLKHESKLLLDSLPVGYVFAERLDKVVEFANRFNLVCCRTFYTAIRSHVYLFLHGVGIQNALFLQIRLLNAGKVIVREEPSYNFVHN